MVLLRGTLTRGVKGLNVDKIQNTVNTNQQPTKKSSGFFSPTRGAPIITLFNALRYTAYCMARCASGMNQSVGNSKLSMKGGMNESITAIKPQYLP